MGQDAVVGVPGRKLRPADAEGAPQFHTFENEVDSKGVLLLAGRVARTLLCGLRFPATRWEGDDSAHRLPPTPGSRWCAG
jgi:hypothetical protein